MNAWTSFSASETGNMFRSLAMFLRWKNVVFVTWEIWFSKDKLLSNITPKYLTVDRARKLRPFWSHMLPKCNLCDPKIYLGAFVLVQIIVVVWPLHFSTKRSQITAQYVPAVSWYNDGPPFYLMRILIIRLVIYNPPITHFRCAPLSSDRVLTQNRPVLFYFSRCLFRTCTNCIEIIFQNVICVEILPSL